jgi:hypothetical protein
MSLQLTWKYELCSQHMVFLNLAPTLAQLKNVEVLFVLQRKQFLFFIPNRLPRWDPGRRSGNPTKSVEVNNLLKEVAKHECHAEVAQSKVKRALTRIEVVKVLSIFESLETFHHRY